MFLSGFSLGMYNIKKSIFDHVSFRIDFSNVSSVQTSGSNITQVIDMSGGRIFTPKSGENPTISTWHGRQIADFTGTKSLIAPLANSQIFSNEKGLCVFAVRRVDNTNQFQTIIGQYRTTATAERIWRLEADRAIVQSNPTTLNNDQLTLRANYPFTVGWEITGMNWIPGQGVEVYRGEILEDTAPQGVSILPTGTVESLMIGGSNASATSGSLLNGAVAEIVGFNRSLTQSEISELVRELHSKWF